MTVMFTHKSNAAWNAMTIGLIEAGFNITRAWPVKTEAESSLHIRDKAAARSTILLVCRPAGERRPQPWPSVAQEITRAVRDDVANLRAGGLNTVGIYRASYGAALKVVSENRSAKRDTANPDLPEYPFGVLPESALAVARQEVITFRSAQITAESGGRALERAHHLRRPGGGHAPGPSAHGHHRRRPAGCGGEAVAGVPRPPLAGRGVQDHL